MDKDTVDLGKFLIFSATCLTFALGFVYVVSQAVTILPTL